jgi:hypothetical protein
MPSTFEGSQRKTMTNSFREKKLWKDGISAAPLGFGVVNRFSFFGTSGDLLSQEGEDFQFAAGR